MDELSRLLRAARDGDDAALTAVVRRSQAEVWRFCAYMVDRSSADDITQEVYLRAWRALPRFRGDSTARTWLLAIARRTCVDVRRRGDRRARLWGRMTRETSVPDAAPAVDLGLLLEDLDADRRSAFLLTQVLGLSYAEAAEVCGCPIGTVRSRVARARVELVRTFDPDRSVRRSNEERRQS